MKDAPVHIKAIRAEGVLEIVWEQGVVCRYPFRLLRQECPCAACVNEFTGERTLNPESVPEDIQPVGVEFSGNYAIKFQWSDGHATGLYSWDRLAQLADAPEVTRAVAPS